MSDRPRRRVVPWERRRLAGIFSAFQALFFFGVLARKLVWTRPLGRKLVWTRRLARKLVRTSGRGGRGEEPRRACGISHVPGATGTDDAAQFAAGSPAALSPGFGFDENRSPSDWNTRKKAGTKITVRIVAATIPPNTAVPTA